MAVPVVSDPVPAVVGTAISGKSFEGIGRPLPSGALTKSRKSASVATHQHPRNQRPKDAKQTQPPQKKPTRKRRVQIHQLRRINHAPPAHRQKRIRPEPFTRLDGLPHARILRLHPHLIVHPKLHPLAVQRLPHHPHDVQLPDVPVRDYHDAPGAQVAQVHAHLARAPGPEADRRGGHLERVFFLLRGVERRREVPARLVDARGRVVVVGRVSVAGA